MSGFVGLADVDARIDQRQTIHEMMETIVHRGPDGEDIFSDDHAALGLRQFSITGMSDESGQIISNEDNSCFLVFDGRIYNHQDLRQELIDKGHRFESNDDSEVVIHAYEEYGLDLFHKLRGMFAFAIWDINTESIVLARDFFGSKPLYYTQNTQDHSFMFGSEIKSFLKNPLYNKELNKEALKPYLTFQYSVLDETFFKGVYKLKPGHYIIYKQGDITIQPYWDAEFNKTEESLEHYVEKINSLMKESVNSHQISDTDGGGGGGVFLSGGIDSSYITALAQPDKTFSVGFQDHEGMFNETHLAKEFADRLDIENEKQLLRADDCFDVLPTIQYYMDEPQSNLSSVPLYYLSQLASQHGRVVLSGEGADELFGGYAWYQKSDKLIAYEKIPYFFRRPISYLAKLLPSNNITDHLVKGGQKVEEKFIGQAKVFSEDDALKILRDDYKKGPSVHDITGNVYEQVKSEDDLTKMQYLDLKLWLPGDILLKADKMSMAHSIEVRMPFLDKEIMSLAAEIPSHLRVNKQATKYALRVAAKDILPSEWANREKVGFSVPLKYWLQEDKYYILVKDTFQSVIAQHFFNTEELMNLLDQHYAGQHNNARYIWTVYVFLVWYNVFF